MFFRFFLSSVVLNYLIIWCNRHGDQPLSGFTAIWISPRMVSCKSQTVFIIILCPVVYLNSSCRFLYMAETIQRSSNLKKCRYKYKERIVWSLELTLVLVTPQLKVLLHGKSFLGQLWKNIEMIFVTNVCIKSLSLFCLQWSNCLHGVSEQGKRTRGSF